MAVPIKIYTTRSQTDSNAPAIDGVAVSGTSTFYSSMWTGEDTNGFSLSVFFTGTPTGTFTEWWSDKPNPDESTDNDWIQDSGFTPTNPAGAAGKFGQQTATARGYRRRLKYVNASGTGVVNAYVTVTRLNN